MRADPKRWRPCTVAARRCRSVANALGRSSRSTVASPRLKVASRCAQSAGASDIDATVEVNGHFLFMEWKSFKGALPTGQRIYFQRLTEASDRITVVVVHGDCETMSVEHIMRIHHGKFSDWEPCSLIELHDRVAAWAKRVDISVVSGEAA